MENPSGRRTSTTQRPLGKLVSCRSSTVTGKKPLEHTRVKFLMQGEETSARLM